MSDPRRKLPAVDALLAEPEIAALARAHPRALVLRAVRDAVEAARADGGAAPREGWPGAIAGRVARLAAPALTPVINATGVVLHTNLGRALLARAAADAIQRIADSYSNLEYDLEQGARGSRHRLCGALLAELTGAEDAIVVNNAAAALLLALSALARGGEAIVSRGELIEIGGQFRIPDILARSGATLVEVGTTNRTHPDDYVRAIGPATRLLLKVHRSNFQVTGFTAEVGSAELVGVARAHQRPLLYDLGSGLLFDLTPWGLAGEPGVREAVASEEIRRRGEALSKGVGDSAELMEGESEVGGGSFPGAKLKTWLVRLVPNHQHLAPDTLAARLRGGTPPVIARIEGDHVVLDPRTIQPTELDATIGAVRRALDG